MHFFTLLTSYLVEVELGSVGLNAAGHAHMVQTQEAAARERNVHDSSSLIFTAPALDSECHTVSAESCDNSGAILNKAPCPQSASIMMMSDE